MNIVYNNQPFEVEVQSTLFDLMLSLQLASKNGIAVALNNEVIYKNSWHTCILRENDHILVITAAKGG